MFKKRISVATIAILAVWSSASAELQRFLPGEIPSLSLVNAANVMERLLKKTSIRIFNPVKADLVAGHEPKSGAWNFVQQDKGGKIYRFVVYFPEDLCLILDEGEGQKLIGAYRRDGSTVKMDEKNKTDHKRSPDPFDD